MNCRRRILRWILSSSFHAVRCKPGYGSYLLTLECGHFATIKASRLTGKGLPSAIYCRECSQLEARP